MNPVRIVAFTAVLLFSPYGLHADGIDKHILQGYLPDNPIIIEAGAHSGIDTVDMARRWPQSTIYAFEPIPSLYEQLKRMANGYKNITCIPLALSNQTGSAKFYVSGGTSDGSSSLLEPKEHLDFHPTVVFNETITVKTITLDDWAEQRGITKVDVLWLDMQGSELDMLKASPKTMSTVKVIHTEVSIRELYKNSPLYPEVRSWLENQGFSVVMEHIPWEDAGNVLFVRR